MVQFRKTRHDSTYTDEKRRNHGYEFNKEASSLKLNFLCSLSNKITQKPLYNINEKQASTLITVQPESNGFVIQQ